MIKSELVGRMKNAEKNGQQWFKKYYNDPKWYTRDYDWKTGIMKETKKKNKKIESTIIITKKNCKK